MSNKTTRTARRVCDGCGKEIEYPEKECSRYMNRFGKSCLSAPNDEWIVLSMPTEEGRKYLDFCCMDCLESAVAFAMTQVKP